MKGCGRWRVLQSVGFIFRRAVTLPSGWKRMGKTGQWGDGRGMNENELLARVTYNPAIFGGKPIIRGHRLAVEHILEMLASGDSAEEILNGFPWLEPEDISACLLYAARILGNEYLAPGLTETAA
jgi:uncharacterized protein (DUF433 family)